MRKSSILCFILCFMLVISSLSFGVSAKETEIASAGEAPVYYIETYEQLKNLAYTAQSDCRYILNDNIYQTDNLNDKEIVIPAGASFNLDLNGYTIIRETQGNDCALFRIKSDARMIINDTSDPRTGSCVFSEGYSDYYKAVFYNEGGELEINGGYYEILSPYEQGDCSVVRTTSGYTNIYNGTFDSSASWGGDTISVGHNAYLYEVPQVVIFGGDFYGKYQSIDVTPFDNYLNYGCLFPSVYVLGGNFYITNGGKDGEDASFAYCNNGWGRVIVAEGTVLAKCLNSRDQMFLPGVSKKLFSETIDDYTGGYYKVTAPPMIMSENLDYYYRLLNLCKKAEVISYIGYNYVHEFCGEEFEDILNSIDTIYVKSDEETSPYIELKNRTLDHKYVNWYMVNESQYKGKDTQWTHIGDAYNISHWQPYERPNEGGSYIIRCVVTNSDLSTYEDIVRIYYAPLEKETETIIIDTAYIEGIDVPLEGNTPDMEALCTTQGYNVSRVQWYDVTESRGVLMAEDDTFVPGRIYRVDVLVEAEENYAFLMIDGYNEATGYINGINAIVYGSHDEKELEIGFMFSPCEENPNKPTNPGNPTNPTQPSTLTDPVATGVLGDANLDGEVNIKDATAIQKYTAQLEALTDTGLILADVDASSDVNIKDATAIQKYIAGIDTGYDIGKEI
ncbi:MAG: dockerin type I repeat-containing protein [Ruminococcus sp.]|nr:dockerin type I repeat-containing protein [Ruminococcus sp.]